MHFATALLRWNSPVPAGPSPSEKTSSIWLYSNGLAQELHPLPENAFSLFFFRYYSLLDEKSQMVTSSLRSSSMIVSHFDLEKTSRDDMIQTARINRNTITFSSMG